MQPATTLGQDLSTAASAGGSALARLCGDKPRPDKPIPFPGKPGVSVTLWSLQDVETRQARMEAIKYLIDTCKMSELHLAHDTDLVQEEVKTQVLFRALRDPDAPTRAFAATPMELRMYLSPDEREALFNEYLSFVDERSPIRKMRSPDEVVAFIEALKKTPDPSILLSYFDSATLRSIIIELGSQLLKQMKPPSWATSPESSSSETSSG